MVTSWSLIGFNWSLIGLSYGYDGDQTNKEVRASYPQLSIMLKTETLLLDYYIIDKTVFNFRKKNQISTTYFCIH